jgi:hypothetical protein
MNKKKKHYEKSSIKRFYKKIKEKIEFEWFMMKIYNKMLEKGVPW